MRNYKKEIKKLRIEILKEALHSGLEFCLGMVGVVAETAFKFSPPYLFYFILNPEIPFELKSTELFEYAIENIYFIKDDLRQIKALKEQEQNETRKAVEETSKELKQPKKEEEKTYNNAILDYSKKLVAGCVSLKQEERQVIISKLKEILDAYIAEYKEILQSSIDENPAIGSMNIYILNQNTFKKLALIETVIENQVKINSQIDLLTKGEAEILSTIDITDELKQQEQPQTLQI